MRGRIGNVVVECVRGDITRQPEFDAIVNAANAQLLPGGGVAGAIHRAAGPELAAEAAPLGPIAPGEAVVTGAYGLPNRYVIHCLGPVYGRDQPASKLLAACYRNALERADELKLSSVAFPAISTGVFGYPLQEAAEVAVRAIAAAAPRLASVRRVRFALFGTDALEAHESVVRALGLEIEGDVG